MDTIRKHKLAIVLTFSLFVLWGMGHRLYDTLVPAFASMFGIGSFRLVLAQSAYSIVYFLFAIPAALYSRTFGSKAALVFGLGSWCVGAFMFYPAAEQKAFDFFLLAAAVMSLGYIFIEIAVNPFVARLGPPESATRRLNFAHALYPVGVLAGLYVGRWVILSDLALPMEKLANAVVRPHMVIGLGVLLLAFLADNASFPALATERESRRAAMRDFSSLWKRPMFLAAVAAQCCNVAAQAGTWTMTERYVQEVLPGASPTLAADLLLLSLVIFGVGRFAGAALMYRFEPDRLLAAFAGSGVLLSLLAAMSGGQIGTFAIVASSFAMSIMFATILGLAIRNLGPLTKAGTALIYMGGAGSAIGVMLMYLIWRASSVHIAMVVPALGYAGVLAFALASCRLSDEKHRETAVQAAE